VDVEASVLRADGEADVASERKLVWLTQRVLKKLKYDPGPLDGKLGSRTVSAIKSYQRDYGLTADGRTSRGLLRHMREKRFET
jgi:peptidoglycan hydrolase-like protein with peptidoglycan-binding domain